MRERVCVMCVCVCYNERRVIEKRGFIYQGEGPNLGKQKWWGRGESMGWRGYSCQVGETFEIFIVVPL